jgi:hypothetical protein
MAWFKSIQDIHHVMVKAMNIVGNDAMTLAPLNVGSKCRLIIAINYPPPAYLSSSKRDKSAP